VLTACATLPTLWRGGSQTRTAISSAEETILGGFAVNVTKSGPIIMTLTFMPLFSAFPIETRFDLRMVHERAELCIEISSVDVEVFDIFSCAWANHCRIYMYLLTLGSRRHGQAHCIPIPSVIEGLSV
jgi:hypothetical protein